MCETCGPPRKSNRKLSRRVFLSFSPALLGVVVWGDASSASTEVRSLDALEVRPREAWADGRQPTGPLEEEHPEDVLFLLVHHSATPNDYQSQDVPRILRDFYSFHTGSTKGWPDVAYNFLIDRFGAIWEGRAGSLEAPVMPDATGGHQGFALSCCFIGNHVDVPPTPEAQRSMVSLLAALAERYGIDTSPGTTVEFESRGSNRWSEGTVVPTTTIAGHRDMSQTACPGDAAYRLVRDDFPYLVTEAQQSLPTSAPSEIRGEDGNGSRPVAGRAHTEKEAVGDGFWLTEAIWSPVGLAGVGVLSGALAFIMRRRMQSPVRDVGPTKQPDASRHGEHEV